MITENFSEDTASLSYTLVSIPSIFSVISLSLLADILPIYIIFPIE